MELSIENTTNAPGCDATPLPTLQDLERIIERGKRSFLEVVDALYEIHSRKLYLKTHATFEAYVIGRWHFSRQHAYRLLDARREIAMSPTGDIPKNERAARARKVGKKKPAKPAAKLVNLDAEVEEFRKKVAHWEKSLVTSDFKKLVENVGRIIGAKLVVLSKTQATAA